MYEELAKDISFDSFLDFISQSPVDDHHVEEFKKAVIEKLDREIDFLKLEQGLK